MPEFSDLRRELRTAREVARQNADAIPRRGAQGRTRFRADRGSRPQSQMAAAARADAGLRALPDPVPARAKKPVYYDGGRHSFYADLAARTALEPLPGISPHEADARRRHMRARWRPVAGSTPSSPSARRRAHGAEFRGGGGQSLSYRDLSETYGEGGEFSPPLYLVSHFANVARAALRRGTSLRAFRYQVVASSW